MNTGTNEANPATLADIIRARRVRKGKADGIDDNGAWWSAWPREDAPMLANIGGDGVGNNPADVRIKLGARHYRCGRVVVGAMLSRWHQNYGQSWHWTPVRALNDAKTAEDVIVSLQGAHIEDSPLRITARARGEIEKFCGSLGIPPAPAAPDEGPEGAMEGGAR